MAGIPPVNVNATTKAKELLSYLNTLTLPGSKHLTGQHNWMGAPTANITNLVLPISGGKYPAITSMEFGEISGKNDTVVYNERVIMTTACINYHNAGGIVAMCYHQAFPLTAPEWFNVQGIVKTQSEFDACTVPGTAQYNWLLAEYDKIAVHLKRLQDNNVPVLFRAYHEMNGYWFWWGKRTPASYTKLWNLIYNRLVVHHGLNNLLWVWCPHNSPRIVDANIADFKLYYPGTASTGKVDVITFDIYQNEFWQSHHDNLWNFAQLMGGRPIGLSEVGGLPNQGTMASSQYRYAYSTAWGETYFSDENTTANKQQYYAHANAITRDEIVIPPLGSDPEDPDPDPPTAGITELRVSGDGRHLVDSNGNSFFWMADTAWELFNRCTRAEVATYLNSCVSHGFNVVQAVALAETWNGSVANSNSDLPMTGTDPTALLTTTGSNPSDSTEYDYWDHVDYTIDLASSLGLYVGLLPTWGRYILDNSGSPYSQPYTAVFDTDQKAYDYGLWIGTRYKNRKNIVWVLGGDRTPFDSTRQERIREMSAGIQASGATQLITFHPLGGTTSSTHFHTSTWLAFNMYQSGHTAANYANYNTITADRAKTPPKPVIDAEPRYEAHPINWVPANGYFGEYDVRQAAYWAVFAGAFGHTYGHHSIWQMYLTSRTGISNPTMEWTAGLTSNGRTQMKHLRRLMESRPLLGSVPDQTMLSGALTLGDHVRAMRGTNYAFFYTRQAITVVLGKISGSSIIAYWYNPKTGAVTTIGTYTNSSTRTFTPSSTGSGNDWVLVLDDVAANYPLPGTTPNPQPPDNPPDPPEDVTPPTAPGSLTLVSKTHNSVTMSWTASTDASGIDVYDIYLNGSYFGYMQDYDNLQYTATGLLPETLHSFTVRAKDWAQNWGPDSDALAVTTDAPPGSGDTTAPTTPTLTLVSKTDTTVTMEWTASTDTSGIELYDIHQDTVYKAFVLGDATLEYTATGLTALTEYSFTVRAKDWAANWGEYSTALVVTTDEAETEEPPEEPETPDTGELIHWTNRDFALNAETINYKPRFKGQTAVVNSIPYIAVGTSTVADWKVLIPGAYTELLLVSPDLTVWKLAVADDGTVSAVEYEPPVPDTDVDPEIYFSDDFDRADNLTSLGSGWTYPYGTWGVFENKAYAVSDEAGNVALYELGSGKTNIDLTVVITGTLVGPDDGNIPAILFRATDFSEFLSVTLFGDFLTLNKTTGFSDTELDSVDVGTLVDGTEYTIQVIANGDNIKVYLDTVETINYTMTTDEYELYGGYTQFGFKLVAFGTPAEPATWDDVVVQSIV